MDNEIENIIGTPDLNPNTAYQNRRRYLILLGLFWLVMGSLDAWLAIKYPSVKLPQFLGGCLIIFIIYKIVVSDAKIRGYRINPMLSVGLIFITIIALPYYLISSRGMKKGLMALIKSTGLLIGFIIIFTIIFVVTQLLLGATSVMPN